MSSLRDYLAEYRGVDVSPTEASALAEYWAELGRRRGSSPTPEQAVDDIPVVFDATKARSDD